MTSFDLITDLPSNQLEQHHQNISSSSSAPSTSFHHQPISPSPSSFSVPPNPLLINNDIYNNTTTTTNETTTTFQVFGGGPQHAGVTTSSSASISFHNNNNNATLTTPIYASLLVATFAACLISGLTFQWVIEKGLFRNKKSFFDKTNQYNLIVAMTAMAALLQSLCCFVNVLLLPPTSANGIGNLFLTLFILLNWMIMTHGSIMIVTRKLSLTYTNAEQAWKKFLFSINGMMFGMVTIPVCVVWSIGSCYYLQSNNDDNMLYYYYEEIIQILEPLQYLLWGVLEFVLSGMFIIQMKKYFWQAVERKGLITLIVVAICDVGVVCMNIFLFLYHHDDNDSMVSTATITLTTACVRGFVYALRIRLELEVLSSMVNYIQNKRKEVVYLARQHEQRTKRRKALLRKRRRNNTISGGRVESSSGKLGSSSELELDDSDHPNNNTELDTSASGYFGSIRRSCKRRSNKLRISLSPNHNHHNDLDASTASGSKRRRQSRNNKLRIILSKMSRTSSGEDSGLGYSFHEDGMNSGDFNDNDSIDSYQSVFDKVLRRRRGDKKKKKKKKHRKNNDSNDDEIDTDDYNVDDNDDDSDDSAASHMSVFQRLPHATDFSNIFQRNFMHDFATATQHSGNVFSSIGKKCRDFAKSVTADAMSVASLGDSVRRNSITSNRRKSSILGSLRGVGGGNQGRRKGGRGRDGRGKCVTSFTSTIRTSSCDEFPIQGMEINVNRNQTTSPSSPYVDFELDFPDDSCALQEEEGGDLEAGGGSAASISSDGLLSPSPRRVGHGYTAVLSDLGRSCSSSSSSDTYDVDKDDDVDDDDGLAEKKRAHWDEAQDQAEMTMEDSRQSSVNYREEGDDDVGPMMFGVARRSVEIDDPPTNLELLSGEEKIQGPTSPTTSATSSRDQQFELRRCASVNNQRLPPLKYSSESARNLRESQIIMQMSHRDQIRRSSRGEESDELLRALEELASMDCL